MDETFYSKRKANPKENANILSLITFFYTKNLFISGYKKDLEDYDLYEIIKKCRSKLCTDRLEDIYQSLKKTGKTRLMEVLFLSYGLQYAALGIFHLGWTLFSSTMQPDAISQLVSYFKPGQTSMTYYDAVYYACVIIGIKLMYVFIYPNYGVLMVQLSLQMKISISSLIYRKILKLSPKALEETNLGNIVTLITKDVDQFEIIIQRVNDVLVGVFQNIYLCYLIYIRVGISAAIGTLILASAIPIQFFVSKIIGKLRTRINTLCDRRLQETREVLSSIRTIKMYNWENIFENRVGQTRKQEVQALLTKGITRTVTILISDSIAKLGFYAIVMLYIHINAMNPETIFYIMSIYATLKASVATVFSYGFSSIAELAACLKRVEKVLTSEELPEFVDKPDDNPQIDIEDVNVKVKNNDILKGVSLKLNAGLNVVSGQLGSGKSSLIKLILKELPIESGELKTRGTKSYASQEPWLFPGSIQQNILFGEAYDHKKYNKVVEVCALTYDFNILQHGDETIIADGGKNLSKGQQARINLARAIYRESDIYLIDDSLSALDTTVQDKVFQNCIQDYLKGKLVILVTHNSKHIAKADKLLIMNKGEIKFASKPETVPEDILKLWEIDDSTEVKVTEITDKNSKSSMDNEKTALLVESSVPKNIYHEEKKKGRVELQLFVKYVQYGGGIWLIGLLFGLFACTTLAESSSQIMLTNWVNHQSSITDMKESYLPHVPDLDPLYEAFFPYLSNNNDTTPAVLPTFIFAPNGTLYNVTEPFVVLDRSNMTSGQIRIFTTLMVLAKHRGQASKALNLYSIILLASVILEFIKQYTVFKCGNNASKKLHKLMINSIISAKMSFFDKFFIGNILNRFSQDLSLVDEAIPSAFGFLIGCVFMCFGVLGTMATVSLDLLIPAIFIPIIFVLLRLVYMPTARSLKRLEAATRSPIVGHLNSSLEGLTTIRAYRAQRILKDEFDKHMDGASSPKYTSLCARYAISFYMDMTGVIFTIAIITRFVFFLDEDTPAGDVGLALTQAGALTSMLQFALMQLSDTENLMTSVERVMEFTKVEQETVTGEYKPNWPSKGEVIYQNVFLQYTNTNQHVLKNITFSVQPNEKIGIVGRTGAGKSSIIATLFRLYNHEGKILIDGVDTKTVSLKQLREHISIIPQDPVLFSGTIRTNLDPLNRFTDEAIWKVLHKVHLDNKVPDLNTLVDDTNFSSGEKQLLSLGRAIVRKNRIVVLDEATANMDHETEAVIQKVIEENFASSTLFIIAHRLESILDCDKVMVLSNGEILEYDAPHQLLENASGIFSKMIKNAGIIKE